MHPVQEKYVKLQRDAEANIVLLQAVREQLTVRDGELAQSQQELAEQKGRCSSMEVSMNAEMASRERTEHELRTAYMQRDAVQGQLDRYGMLCSPLKVSLTAELYCVRRKRPVMHLLIVYGDAVSANLHSFCTCGV
jgi:septal ring factor EnvC (AmiA/AmiB activator)